MEINHKDLPEETHNAIIQLEDHLWGPIAHVIGVVQRDKLWRHGFANFSEWMTFLSETYDISRARCWRYKKAGEYYNKLRLENESLCLLTELPSYVSAEALEILERIKRVAPREVTLKIETQILDGDISIRTLKQTWEAYRPALHGATTRGRGNSNSVAEIDDEARFGLESILLLSQNSSWTGVNMPARCHVYPNVNDQQNQRSYDALALVQKHLDSPVEIHTFELCYQMSNSVFEIPRSHESYVDYHWLVTNNANDSLMKYSSEADCGLLEVFDNGLHIHKTAFKIDHVDSESQPFLKELLKLALRK